jgi:hypothetical protein
MHTNQYTNSDPDAYTGVYYRTSDAYTDSYSGFADTGAHADITRKLEYRCPSPK